MTSAALVASLGCAPGCNDRPVVAVASPTASIDASIDVTSAMEAQAPPEELGAIDVAAPTKRITDLSSNERVLLCNWNAREYGGYGGNLRCLTDANVPSIGAPIGADDCLSTLEIGLWGARCPLTVEDFMACVDWQVREVCTVKDGGGWPAACETQYGPLCIGGIGKDADADGGDGAVDRAALADDGASNAGDTAPAAD